MKSRIFFWGIFFLWIGLTGCSSYYYSIVGSNDRQSGRNAEGDFIQETDTVCIAYSFNGENAPVSISIYNKLDEPLFVDWEQSALIIDEVATPYLAEGASVEGEVASSSVGGSYRWSDRSADSYSHSYGKFAGSVSLPKQLTFVPPKSRIVHTPLYLADFPFDKIPKSEYRNGTLPTADGGKVNMQIKEFTEEDSPVYFRSYLTLYAGDPRQSGHTRMNFERSFYVEKLIKTGNVPPEELTERQRLSGDFFYIHKVKGAKAGVIIGTIAIGAAGVAIEATLEPTE